jgi:DNA/RNA-binding domain of Phe-tRNA-synthetase-like protein
MCIGAAEIINVGANVNQEEEISDEMGKVENEIRGKYKIEGVKDIREIRLQRDFFWGMGVDPTKVRPASEALLRRILLGKGLPRISPLVDAYNIASVKTLLTFSAFDRERVEMDQKLRVRFAKEGEKVTLIGMRKKELTGKEIVLADAARILCVYVHGDVEETKITDSTRDVLLVAYGMPGISKEEIEMGLIVASSYITRFAGAEAEVVKKKVYE